MAHQFVDLFDKEKHGLNYWVGIMAVVGMLALSAFDAGQGTYLILVREVVFSTPAGEPMNLGSWLLMSLRWSLPGAIGFGTVLVASATLMKRDLHLPFAAGILWVVWWMVIRLSGIVDAPAFDPWTLATDFGWCFLSLGSLVVLYRVLHNKLIALSLGMAFGSMLGMAFRAFRYGNPIGLYAEQLAEQLCLGLILGVFIFAGIAKHFSTRGMHFGEFGPASGNEGATAGSPTEAALGKTRRPLVMLLLMLATFNIYLIGWLYKVYGEIRRRSPEATTVTPGMALGFLFIPVFNLFWALWLHYDLPRAIERMERADPPAGVAPQSWIITGSLVGGVAAGLASNLWLPALYLNVVLIWTGVLLAQSSLNSHWLAHRTAADAA